MYPNNSKAAYHIPRFTYITFNEHEVDSLFLKEKIIFVHNATVTDKTNTFSRDLIIEISAI